jgi:TonB family protein
VLPRRRHLLIWSAVTVAHLAALAAVWAGARLGQGKVRPPEGGLLLVVLTPEASIALPGEVPLGDGLGGGALPVPFPVAAVPVASVVSAFSAPVVPTAPVALPSEGPVAAAPAPVVAARPDTFRPPAFLERVEPAYPERARRAGIEGVATVRVRLDRAGAVLGVELVEPSGSRLLDEAALAAARASRFAPALRAQTAVAAEALATYRFELR